MRAGRPNAPAPTRTGRPPGPATENSPSITTLEEALMSQSENLGEESKDLLAETGQTEQEAMNLGLDDQAASDAPATEGGERGAGA